MSTRPDAPEAACTNASIAALSVTSTTLVAHSPPAAAQRRCVSSSSSPSTSQAHTRAPRCVKARLMARPMPCAAPVTMTVLASKVRFIRGRDSLSRRERLQCLERLRPLAVLDVVNQLDQTRQERRGYVRFAAERDDDAELRIDFRAPFSHREVAPDATVRLCRPAIVR